MSEQATGNGSKKEIEIPEWEDAAVGHKTKGAAGGLIGSRSMLDRLLPPQKRYLGLKRKTFLWIILATSLCLLALIIGLSPGLGACGVTSTEDDFIVALSHVLFDAAGSSTDAGGNSNENPLCGRMLRATRYNEEANAQRSVDLRVVDRCTGCEVDDLDTSLKAFERLAPSASGRVDVSWAWLQPFQTGS
ncbi:hypothetical protein D0864_05008 [Hortaea werneckii]|uniref:RlpA-like protein double-psi beta-barrel domain-containing protein n=1 Tax=Hortaea werneckii TaxID=91943 RepID=A0A3M7G8A3_HORWE|nr:hypothetical protein D0864_05008 [Hortaea werneckii]